MSEKMNVLIENRKLKRKLSIQEKRIENLLKLANLCSHIRTESEAEIAEDFARECQAKDQELLKELEAIK